MIKHTTALCTLVVLLVGSLMYCISPGEFQIVWSVAKDRLSMVAGEVLPVTLQRAIGTIEHDGEERAAPRIERNITPDPFRPFGPPKPSDASRLLSWLKGPQLLTVWVSMAALILAGGYAGRRRFKFIIERRMAITLAKAVRQDALYSPGVVTDKR